MIYLDNAATVKPNDTVVNAVTKCLYEYWGNPSSLHNIGLKAKKIVEDTRKKVADFIGAKPQEIIFTSGACEANSLAICGYLNSHMSILISTYIEHKSILNIIDSENYKTTILSVNNEGKVDLDELNRVLETCTIPNPLVSIQWANNEIGTVQDMEKISEIVHRHNGILHTDATQIVPDRKINVAGIDMLSFSGQKIGAPKGIGVLYVREGIEIQPLIYGAQENGLRGGTENVPYIAGLGAAIDTLVYPTFEKYSYFCKHLMEEVEDSSIVGCSDETSLNTIVALKIDGINAENLLYILEIYQVYASVGSACNSHAVEASTVLRAIGLDTDEAQSVIRFSFHADITTQDLDHAVEKIRQCVLYLRELKEEAQWMQQQ